MYVGDRWHAESGVVIKNFEFLNGVEPCITIWSECDYKGVSFDVCGDSPDLKTAGWDYVVKAVEIPADYDRTVTLWTEVNFKSKKLVLESSAKCI